MRGNIPVITFVVVMCALLMVLAFHHVDIWWKQEQKRETSQVSQMKQPDQIAVVSQVLQTHESLKPDTSLDWVKIFDFVPMGDNNCASLFNGQDKTKPLSALYYQEFDKFNAHLKAKFPKTIEGHSENLIEETMTYWRIANQSHVHTICETGFHAGHSTLTWLMANSNVHVYTFDIARYEYTTFMGEYVVKTYPGRVTTIWGDSTKTLPKFIKEHPEVKCDIVVVDGGHTKEVATADLKNMRLMANPKNNVLCYDDYPNYKRLAEPWELGKRRGEISEIFYCSYKNKDRGFTLARYVYH